MFRSVAFFKKASSFHIKLPSVLKYNFSTKHHHSPADTNKPETNGDFAKDQFDKRINQISNTTEDISSIEQYVKTFNDKVYKQNLELSNKLQELFQDESKSGAKIFTAVNEINKINLNNSATLLDVFLKQILKYNDSVRLFIKQNEKKYTRYNYMYPWTLAIVWLCVGAYFYEIFIRKRVRTEAIIERMIKNYLEFSPQFFKTNKVIPIFDDHKNITNSINFDLSSNLVLIGPEAMGKTESINYFCLSQNQKDSLTIYINLDKIGLRHSFQKVVSTTLSKNSEIVNSENIEFLHSEEFCSKLLDILSTRSQVTFIFDNYRNSRDENFIFEKALPAIRNVKAFKSVTLANNNEIYKKAKFNNVQVKYLNFSSTRAFKNFLVEKINSYLKKRIEFSNVELFNEENLKSLFEQEYFFSFDDLQKYISKNNSLQCKNYYFKNNSIP
jgi:hypothetical protein